MSINGFKYRKKGGNFSYTRQGEKGGKKITIFIYSGPICILFICLCETRWCALFALPCHSLIREPIDRSKKAAVEVHYEAELAACRDQGQSDEIQWAKSLS